MLPRGFGCRTNVEPTSRRVRSQETAAGRFTRATESETIERGGRPLVHLGRWVYD